MVRALNLYLNDHPGWRRYLVLKEGRIHATILNTEDASTLKVPVGVLTTYSHIMMNTKPIQLQPRRMSKRLRAVAKTYGREDTAAVKLALKLLKEAKQ